MAGKKRIKKEIHVKGLLMMYLILAVIYGFLGLINTVSFSIIRGVTLFSYFVGIVAFAWWIFNIIISIKFLKAKLNKIYLVLPVYYVAAFILLFIYSSVYAVILRTSIIPGSVFIGLSTSLFEILFASYLLKTIEL